MTRTIQSSNMYDCMPRTLSQGAGSGGTGGQAGGGSQERGAGGGAGGGSLPGSKTCQHKKKSEARKPLSFTSQCLFVSKGAVTDSY
jgi:hypothetical protein